MKTKSTYLVVLMIFFLTIKTEFSFGQSVRNQTESEVIKLNFESKFKDVEKKDKEFSVQNSDDLTKVAIQTDYVSEISEEERIAIAESRQNEMFLQAKGIEELIPDLQDTFNVVVDAPVSCTGSLPPFTDVRRGKITSEIIIAKDYYLDPRNQEGTLEERREKVRMVIKKIFSEFVAQRTAEYKSVKCHYRGIDWNKAGGSSWKTITCQPGFYFIAGSLVRTQNGDWKRGPEWGVNYSTLSWKTGGYRKNKTFAEVDAEYFDIDNKVLDELNSARKILHDLGIPTELP
ncbi:hypothetical protein [Flavobacterium sp. T12S277]|uniref:hypothetical protein n=1 Tax=Flavobacterium sp. T12S277 TaxID=3402752 RepID=UPI003ADFF96C